METITIILAIIAYIVLIIFGISNIIDIFRPKKQNIVINQEDFDGWLRILENKVQEVATVDKDKTNPSFNGIKITKTAEEDTLQRKKWKEVMDRTCTCPSCSCNTNIRYYGVGLGSASEQGQFFSNCYNCGTQWNTYFNKREVGLL